MLHLLYEFCAPVDIDPLTGLRVDLVDQAPPPATGSAWLGALGVLPLLALPCAVGALAAVFDLWPL